MMKLDRRMSFLSFFLSHHTTAGILVSQSEVKPAPPTVDKWSPRHWTTRGRPQLLELMGGERMLATQGDR